MKLVEALSKMSGMSEKTIHEIYEEVMANRKLLNSCEGPHDFSIPFRKVGNLVRNWQCTKCKGTIESSNKAWYELGLEHAKRINQKGK